MAYVFPSMFNCKPVPYNSSAPWAVQRWPAWSKFIRLCLSIQPFFSSPISAVIRILIQPSFLSLHALIQSALFPQTVGACTYFFCCLKGGESDLALLSAMSCVFFIWCERFASPLSRNKHSQMTETGLQKVFLCLLLIPMTLLPSDWKCTSAPKKYKKQCKIYTFCNCSCSGILTRF